MKWGKLLFDRKYYYFIALGFFGLVRFDFQGFTQLLTATTTVKVALDVID